MRLFLSGENSNRTSVCQGLAKGHHFKLFQRRFRFANGKHSFSNRVVDEWNRLRDNVFTAEGLNSFKGQLNKYLSSIRGLK